uniref:MBD domain-containing protein n=1 Tax=Oryza barthii TaxID=65489 RepID=A0A0D3H4R6_9ORYZ
MTQGTIRRGTHGPSGLPSSGDGKGKGVAITGANPWYSGDDSDGSNSISDSERTVTADFRIFVCILVVMVIRRWILVRLITTRQIQKPIARELRAASFGMIANSFSNSLHFSPMWTLSCSQEKGKTQVKNNKDIPEAWKVHPRKDEVDPTGWDIENHLRNDQKTKDKQYYRHKDYNHKFRSKPEVQYFLDTGKAASATPIQCTCCCSRLLHDARVYEMFQDYMVSYLLDVRAVLQPRHQRHQPSRARHEDDGTIPRDPSLSYRGKYLRASKVYNKERSFKAIEMASVIGLFAIDDRCLMLCV